MTHLPIEVLENIFAWLSSTPHDVVSLYQCTLVCRYWHDLANIVLWRKPVLTSKKSRDVCLSVIRNNPLFASYVQDWPYESKLLHTDLLPYLPNLRNIGYMSARALEPKKFKKVWHLRRIDHLDYCVTDGPEAFQKLVALCPRLEKLTIRINSLDKMSSFTAWKRLNRVISLKHLKIINSEYGVGENQACFIRSFISRLPNLQSLEIESYTFSGYEIDGLSLNCINLSSLSIVTTALGQYQIGHLANELERGVGKRINKLQLIVSRTTRNTPSLAKIFTSLKSLMELSLYRFEIDDNTLESLTCCTRGTLGILKLGCVSPPSQDFFSYQRSVQLWDTFFFGVSNSLIDITFNESFGNFRDMISGGVSKYCFKLEKLTVKYHEDNFVCPIIRGCGKSLRYLEYSECFVTEGALSTIFEHTPNLKSLIVMEHKHNAHRPKANPSRFQDFMRRSGSTLHTLTMTGVEMNGDSISEIQRYGRNLRYLNLDGINSFQQKERIIFELHSAKPNLHTVHIELIKPWDLK